MTASPTVRETVRCPIHLSAAGESASLFPNFKQTPLPPLTYRANVLTISQASGRHTASCRNTNQPINQAARFSALKRRWPNR